MMMWVLSVILLGLLACGIKSDPVPPVKPTDWGKSLDNEDRLKKKEGNEDNET